MSDRMTDEDLAELGEDLAKAIAPPEPISRLYKALVAERAEVERLCSLFALLSRESDAILRERDEAREVAERLMSTPLPWGER